MLPNFLSWGALWAKGRRTLVFGTSYCIDMWYCVGEWNAQPSLAPYMAARHTK